MYRLHALVKNIHELSPTDCLCLSIIFMLSSTDYMCLSIIFMNCHLQTACACQLYSWTVTYRLCVRVNSIHELTYRLHVLVNNFHEPPPSVCILSRSWTANFCKHFLMSGGTPTERDNVTRFLASGFLWIFFPQAPENNTVVILNCLKACGDIHKSRCTTGVSYIGGKFCHR